MTIDRPLIFTVARLPAVGVLARSSRSSLFE